MYIHLKLTAVEFIFWKPYYNAKNYFWRFKQILQFTSKAIPFKVSERNIERNRVKDDKVTCQVTNAKHYDKAKPSSYSP